MSLPSCSNFQKEPFGYNYEWDNNLDSSTFQWFKNVLEMWGTCKLSPAVKQQFNRFFENATNPYKEVLLILTTCTNRNENKPKSLGVAFINTFYEWLKNYDSANGGGGKDRLKTKYLNQETKLVAFNLTKYQKNLMQMKQIVEIYELDKDVDLFLPIIKYMILKKEYKEACQLIMLLNLYEHFEVKEFVIPLILQDKLTIVEDYLKENKKHQIDTLLFLDNLLDNSTNESILNKIDNFIIKNEIPLVNKTKFHSKPMLKLIGRFLKLFNISSTDLKNWSQTKGAGHVRFLVKKRFLDNQINKDDWNCMVKEAINDSDSLKMELVYLLSVYSPKDGIKWANYYNIPEDQWPISMKDFDENQFNKNEIYNTSKNDSSYEESWNQNKLDDESSLPFYKLPIPYENIVIIDTYEKLNTFLNNELKDTTVIGIDSEWQPTFLKSKSQTNNLSLIQIATKTHVFILDIFELLKTDELHDELWQKLSDNVLANANIIKLGFGIFTDLQIINRSLPELHLELGLNASFLDLCCLWQELINKQIFDFFPYSYPPDSIGKQSLSILLQISLNKRLDKSDQISMWDRRPLRDEQIKYAASDAYCLIEIYEAIMNLAKSYSRKKLDVDEIIYKVNFDIENKWSKKCREISYDSKKSSRSSSKNNDQDNSQFPSPFKDGDVNSSKTFKFVCDNMILNLQRWMCQCGIDCSYLDQYSNNHNELVKISELENRIIITNSSQYKKIKNKVPPGHCYKVISQNVEDQLKEVLSYYNIVIKKEDIFSRCQYCNTNNFAKVNKDVIELMLRNFKKFNPTTNQTKNLKQSDLNPSSYDIDDFGDGAIAATGFTSDEYSSDDDFEETRPPIKINMNLVSDKQIDTEYCLTRFNVPVKLNELNENILKYYDLFYICEHCGHIYWDGSHLTRVLDGKFKNIAQ